MRGMWPTMMFLSKVSNKSNILLHDGSANTYFRGKQAGTIVFEELFEDSTS
jgi:hypothetical protein